MKKLFVFTMVICLLFNLSGCKKTTSSNGSDVSEVDYSDADFIADNGEENDSPSDNGEHTDNPSGGSQGGEQQTEPSTPTPTIGDEGDVSDTNTPKYVAKKVDTKGKKLVAFSFDDAPNGNTTSALMDLFYENDAHCTFMLIGQRLGTGHSYLLNNMINAGMELGNHSYSHITMTGFSKQEVIDDYTKMQNYVKDLTGGYVMKVARLPEQTGNATIYDAFKNNLKLQLFACVDTVGVPGGPLYDYKADYEPVNFLTCVSKSVFDGAIYTCHNTPNTLAAMKLVIPELKSMGYAFVTISELVEARGVEIPLGCQIRSISSSGKIVTLE